MEKGDLKELFEFLYKITVKDNEEDFKQLYWIVTKVVTTLVAKNVVTEDEMRFILELDKPPIEEKEK